MAHRMMGIFQKDTLARSRTIWDSKSMLVMDFNLQKKTRIYKYNQEKWINEQENGKIFLTTEYQSTNIEGVILFQGIILLFLWKPSLGNNCSNDWHR